MSRLAIDVGTVRLGIAKSDELGIMAHPVATIPAEPSEKAVAEIRRLIVQHQVKEIVVGYPRNLDGTVGPSAKRAEAFAAVVRETTGLPVTMWDERLSSVASQRMLIERGMRRRARKGVVDQLAAVLILQNYLDAHKPSRFPQT